jgi:hypothetical protein
MLTRGAPAAMLCVAFAIAMTAGAGAGPATNPAAVSAVKQYVGALQGPNAEKAFALLTPAQKRYFGNVRNFASNFSATTFRVISYSISKVTMRNAGLAQVDVAEKISYYDIASEQPATADVIEPYFALRNGEHWGVKKFQPWKSYAPLTTGRAGGLVVIVDRIEFFDRRMQVDCTFRNLGSKPIQVLPLLKSKLTTSTGVKTAAMNVPNSPLTDRQLFEGLRLYPGHQVVGFMNVELPSRIDADMTATLVIAPVIEDGASAPITVTVGPIHLRKL